MKNLSIALLVLFFSMFLFVLLTGCSPAPVKIVLEQQNVPRTEPLVLEVKQVPKKPLLKLVEIDNVQYGALTTDGLDSLKQAYIIAETNTELLENTVELTNMGIAERNKVMELLVLEQNRSKMLADMYIVAENQRRHDEYVSGIREYFYMFLVLLALGVAI